MSLREIERVLGGTQGDRFMVEAFDEPDTGIVFGLDSHDCPIIKRIEDQSNAFRRTTLVPGLRLYKINQQDIPQNKESMAVITKLLLKSDDDGHPLIFEFLEPKLVVNNFSTALDVLIEGQEINILLPIGAVNDIDVFEQAVNETFAKTNRILKLLNVTFDRRTMAMTISSDILPFQLLFETGA